MVMRRRQTQIGEEKFHVLSHIRVIRDVTDPVGPATALSDAALLRAAALYDDCHAFDELVRRSAPQLHAMAYRLVHPSYVDDVVQQTYLNAWRSRTTYRQEAAPMSWLVSIMRNVATSRHHRPADKTEPLEDDLAVTVSADDIEAFVLAETIDAALAVLEDWQAVIIRRRHLEGQSWQTITTAMCFRNEYFAKKAYAVAKKNLARLLSPPPPALGAP